MDQTELSESDRRDLAADPDIDSLSLLRALGDPSPLVREAAADNHAAQPYHLEVALQDSHWAVRCAALENPRVTHKQAIGGLYDSNSRCREAATRQLKARMFHEPDIEKATEIFRELHRHFPVDR